MTSLTITIRHVWLGPIGGAIVTGHDLAGGQYRVVIPKMVIHRAPQVGESWTVEGSIREHPKFGTQFHAESAVPVPPKGELITQFLARSRAFQGVGEVRARKLWSAFGDGLYALLDGKEVAQLAAVLGKEELAISLLDAWQECRAEGLVVRWLEHHGFATRLATKVMKLWGTEAPEKIRENPYRMLAVDGWERVDTAALALGIAPEAEIRKIAAVEATCYRAMASKNTVVLEDDLMRGIASLLRQPRGSAWDAIRLAEADHAVVKLSGACWQALGPHTMETYVKARIAGMVAAENVPSGHLLWRVPSDNEVKTLLNEFQAQNSLQLTNEQEHAVWLALTQRCSAISGGAGTGKTTLLKAVFHTVHACNGTVHTLALAGRAAVRLQEATGHPARTIAGFLAAHDRGDISLGGGDLVVVDEASMLDLPLAYMLLRAIPEDARLLLIGDPYQLPPIGMGTVFSALTGPATECDQAVPQVELTMVHRQSKETGIPLIASQIRMGVLPDLGPYTGPGKGITFIDCSEREALGQIVEVLGDLGGPSEAQILGAIKRGPAGVKAINSALHALRSAGKPDWVGYSQNDPVIWLENDYKRGIYNGTLGVVESVEPSSITVNWDGHDKPMAMVTEDLESLDLAYAITTHKSQGSQFRRVIVPVFKTRLLDRTLVYTALTRATEQVVLLGDRDACRAAVQSTPASHRRLTGMKGM